MSKILKGIEEFLLCTLYYDSHVICSRRISTKDSMVRGAKEISTFCTYLKIGKKTSSHNYSCPKRYFYSETIAVEQFILFRLYLMCH